MCRIAAIVSSELDNLESGIKKITQIMHRGGPDHEGILVNPELGYALGHRRLSIIDISDQGNQPMNYLNERYEISFNGEIYNFKELKAELAEMGYLFNTNSDTEVILAGFAAWKEDMLIKLQGMFAFIIIDKETATLFAARDSMGIKPLYFGKKGGEFYFSSEVKGFLAIDSNWEVNLEWPVWFLTFGFLPEPVTTLQNVCPLPKGHYLKMDLYNHHFEKTCWFKPHFCDTSMDSDAAINKTRQLVEDAVKRHLIADVEVGVFLSGGVDSSILTLLAAKNSNTQIRTLSIDFEDDLFSERKYQELIIKKAGTNHQNFIVKESDFVQQWKEIF